jgi:hypothetical protein
LLQTGLADGDLDEVLRRVLEPGGDRLEQDAVVERTRLPGGRTFAERSCGGLGRRSGLVGAGLRDSGADGLAGPRVHTGQRACHVVLLGSVPGPPYVSRVGPCG